MRSKGVDVCLVSNPSKSKPNLLEDAMAKLQRTNAILSCLSDVANDGRVERVQSLVRSPKDGVDGSRCPNGLAANNRGQSRTQDDAAALRLTRCTVQLGL